MAEATAISRPAGPGPHPAVVIGAEAYGPNEFSEGVQKRLAALGFASCVPDYYRGAGPEHREAYDDYTEVVEHIAKLDFTRATRDLAHTVDTVREDPGIDESRVALWGYCTGATLAWLAACMRGDVAAAVLFFPSQPWFDDLSPAHPVHPVDLLWQLTCPTLFLYGDQDVVMSAESLAQLRARIDEWQVDAVVEVYEGAGHAFSAPWGPLRHERADQLAWDRAVEFLHRHVG